MSAFAQAIILLSTLIGGLGLWLGWFTSVFWTAMSVAAAWVAAGVRDELEIESLIREAERRRRGERKEFEPVDASAPSARDELGAA